MASKNSSVIFDIGAKVDKSFKSSLNAVGTSFSAFGKHISKNYKAMTNGENAIKNYQKKIEGLRNILDNTTDSEGSILSNGSTPTPVDESQLNSTLKGYMETIRHAQSMIQQLHAENPLNSETGKTKFEEDIENTKQAIKDFEKEIDNLTSDNTKSIDWDKILSAKDLDKIKSKVKDTDFKNSASITKLRTRNTEIGNAVNSNPQVLQAKVNLANAEQSKNTFANTKGEGARGWKTRVAEVTKAEKQLQAVRKSVEDEYAQELEANNKKLQQLTNLTNLSSKSEIYGEAKTLALKTASSTLEGLNKALDTNTKKLATNTESLAHQSSIVDTAKTKYAEYISSKQQELSITEKYLADVEQRVSEAVDNVSNTIRNFTVNHMVSMFNKLGNSVKQFGKLSVKWLGKAAGSVGKTAAKAVGLEQIMKTMIQYGFGFRSLYYLINNLKSALGEGLTYLSQASGSADTYVQEAATQMKSLLTEVKELIAYLKAAGGAMIQPFMPLIQTILPKLVSWFNTLSNTVARFLAQLTGQKYFIKASTNLEDYANALDDTTSSAKKAADALGAYDKLNVIDQDTGSGSSASGIDTSNWYSSEEVGSNSIIEEIKSAWSELKNNDWSAELQASFEGIGQDIGNLISTQLASIDWDASIIPMSSKLAKALASMINGLFSDTNLGTEAGNAIAQALNTLVAFTANFFGTLDFSTLGQSLSDAINKFFNTFDFSSMGGIVNSITTGALTMLNEVVGDPSFGTNVGTAIGKLFAGLDVSGIGADLLTFAGNLASAVADALKSWAETDPESFGIATAIGIAVVGVKITSALVSPLGEVLATSIGNVLTEKLTTKISTSLGSSLANIDLSTAITSLSTTCSSLLSSAGSSIAESISGFMSSVMENGLFSTIGTNVSGFISTLESTLGGGISSLFSGIGSTISGIVSSLSGFVSVAAPIAAVVAIVIALVAGFKRAYEESEEFRDQVNSAVESVGEVLQGIWDDVISPVFELIKSIVEPIMDSIIELCSKLWKSILPPIISVLKNVASVISQTILPIIQKVITIVQKLWNIIEPVITGIISILGDILSVVISVISHIISVVSPILSFIANTLGNLISAALDVVIALFESVSDWWSNLWDGIKSTSKSIANGVIGIINKLLSAIQSGLNWVISKLNKIGFTLPSFLGGERIGFNLKEIEISKIPYLAQGAVIPPNKEFMAVLGDQKHGTNIEAPLDTIKQALAETLAELGGGTNSQPIVLQLDGKTVAKVVWDENKKRYKQTGKSYAY